MRGSTAQVFFDWEIVLSLYIGADSGVVLHRWYLLNPSGVQASSVALNQGHLLVGPGSVCL